MDNKKYESILPIKLQGLIALILEKEKLTFVNTLHYLYESELYKNLANEETKIWHLSNHKLYLMLNEEKKGNDFRYPDYV